MDSRVIVSTESDLQTNTEAYHAPADDCVKADRWYARYVLFVLLLVYICNFIDRQILAILAEDIKADLGISDAELGFLFGTAFAVFYAVFGIPLGRLADIWNRKQLISIGLGFWSLMTALSGTARSFLPLALCRFGVGVGEASATPAAYSILYDYFPLRIRTTIVSIYVSGIFIGAGAGMLVGGVFLQAWNDLWPDASLAPFGLKGWQATFMVVGLPGLLLALWVSTLREPLRGQSDGILSERHPHPFRESTTVFLSMVPVINLWVLARVGCSGRALVINLAAALFIGAGALGLTYLTDSLLQWAALGIGVYAAISWVQLLSARDPVVLGMIFRCKTLLNIIFGASAGVFMGIALGFWAVPFFQRYYGVSTTEVGTVLGLSYAVTGLIGVVAGGYLADKLRAHTRKGKLYVWFGSMLASLVAALIFLTSNDLTTAYVSISSMYFTGAMASGPVASTINDLVLPRGRATSFAFFTLVSIFIGAALGPYLTGCISDSLIATGVGEGEALRQAMLWSLLLPTVGLLLVIQALRHIEADEASLLDRARALGENI